MLEGLVAWVLNTYLGKYVENLNTHQLSIALLQGEVEFENLPLKKDALRHFGLPIQVRAGFIGKIKLQIPVRAIRSAPWVIQIEQLYLVAGPVRLNEWDEETEEQVAQEYKLSVLDNLEAQWRAEFGNQTQGSSYYASSYSSWLSYGTSLVTNVVENLQLKIIDVHIRYEDDITVPNEAFAFGITLDTLSAQSCDDTWQPRYLSGDSGPNSFKLLELSALGVYWDKLDSSGLLGDLSLGDLAVALSQVGVKFKSHNFLLSPVSAQAHVKRNRSEQPLRSRLQPRIVCDLHLEEVPLSLYDWQYGQMVGCLKGLQTIEKMQRFRKYRPVSSVKDDPRSWWMYLAQCNSPRLIQQNRAHTWEDALKLAKENVQYVTAYEQLLSNPSMTLSAQTKEMKDAMEHTRSLEDLRILREVAMRRVCPAPLPVDKSSPAGNVATGASAGRGILHQWFPAWWGWSEAEQGTVEGLESSVEQQIEGQLLDALADTVDNNSLLRRDVVFCQMNFTLKEGTFHLCSLEKEQSEQQGEQTQEDTKRSVLELQFENVQLNLESRPRTGSQRISVSLGGIYVWDRLTKDTVFPVLVAPQGHDSAPSALAGRGPRAFPPGLQRLRSQGSGSIGATSTPNTARRTSQTEEALFELVYELKPFNSTSDYRLHVRSQSLDVVYNPAAVEWLTNFFTQPYQQLDGALRQAARHGYQAMKRRTRQELMRNWEELLEGHLSNRKTWELELNISAPQIILVEHFCDKNAVIAVVDFGRFHLSTQDSHRIETQAPPPLITTTRDSDDEDDAFQTPCSTPPGSAASESGSEKDEVIDETLNSQMSGDVNKEGLNEWSLHHRLYDRYTVEFGDLQILVGKVKDNWKYAHLKGTSTLHVLDRFNISLQIERRVVFTRDPQFPSLTVSGNLPKLVVHVNESKIDALRTMVDIISGRGLPSPFRSQEPPTTKDNSEVSDPDENMSAEKDEEIHIEKTMSRLVMLQFSIDQMALEVQSRGRSVAELQVSGVRAGFTKRPFDTSLSLSVHSLLLVDALQTFGPDFELLVASHKHVGMDSVSGSLRDSEPTSPTSPGSPSPDVQSPRSTKFTTPLALTQALSSLQHDSSGPRAISPSWSVPSPPPMITSPQFLPGGGLSARASYVGLDTFDHEALITIEILLVSPDCPTNNDPNDPSPREALQIVSVQFNNLDIIANQETIVELIGFSRRVFPQLKKRSTATHVPRSSSPSGRSASQSRTEHMSHSPSPSAATQIPQGLGSALSPPTARTELSFDFHRLNVLLLRAVLKDNVHTGRKIATATMSEAKIHATIGQQLVVGGSLGGLQVLDLTPEGQKHQRILSLGKDPLVSDRQPDLVTCLGADLYSMGQPSGSTCPEEKQVQAFSFSVSRSLESIVPGPVSSGERGLSSNQQESEAVDVKIRMASVLYTHSPCLVNELGSCASEFKQYLSNLASSIKSAATEMALGLVHARAEALAQSLYMSSRLSASFYGGSGSELSSPKRRRRSVSRSSEVYESVSNTTNPSLCNTKGNVTPTSPGDGDEDSLASATELRLDVVLDTPVVVVPRCPTSSEVLVAHLGKISISNIHDSNPAGVQDSQEHLWGTGQSKEQYSIEIRDMNLFSLDTLKTIESTKKPGGLLSHGHVDSLLRAEQLYACSEAGVPILHDTVIKLEVARVMGCGIMQKSDSLSSLLLDDNTADFNEYQSQDSLQVSGSVVTALKVSLSRQQYEQVLDTVNSLLTGMVQPCSSSVMSSSQLVQNTAAAAVQRAPLGDIAEEESDMHTGVSTLNMDSTLRSRMLHQGPPTVEYSRPAPPHRITIKVSFELPIFTLELKGDLGNGEQGLVDLSCSDFKLQFERQRPYETVIEMSLRSLLMEDLLQPPDSKHRFLLVSSNGSEASRSQYCDVPAFVSKSCPNLSGNSIGTNNLLHENYLRPHHYHHGSLPDHLENESAFVSSKAKVSHRQSRKTAPSGVGEYPSTPPPSPLHHSSGRLRDDTLVRINIVLIDRNAPKLTSLFNNIHRSISVDFNTLDVIVNVESWVVILDFFGFGPSTGAPQPKEQVVKSSGSETVEGTQGDNVKLELEVWSLTLVLNKPEYEVARANVSQLSATVVNRNNNLSLDGRLGKMSLMDATPHSAFYRERFISSGSEALNVHFFRFGAPDPLLKREYDSQLKIEMSSVLYVHTQRFLAEINAFFRHFSQLQNVLINIRSANQVQEKAVRRSRRLLVLTAGSPVLLLPLSSHSTEILVADLGRLSITNKFLHAASQGTISKVCAEPEKPNDWPLLDVMQIDLVNMDLYAGQRLPASDNMREMSLLHLGSFVVAKRGPSLLREKCQLKLQLESNLDSMLSHSVPDMSVQGTLSRLSAAVDLSQYRLIRGLLSYNIGECLDDIDVQVAETSFNNSSLSALSAPSCSDVWMLMSIHLDLVDVTLKLQLNHGPEPWCDLSPGQTHIPSQGEGESSLACINFIKSRLTVETYSDRSQDVDLVSQEILITDTRFQDEPVNKRSNVFTNILQPINMIYSKDMVQAEIHHRKRRDYSKFTILLNSMRLMAILDWWEVIKDFISENAEDPFTNLEKVNVSNAKPIQTDEIDGDNPVVPYELKLNITASEVVVVEDTSQWDANAVILKSTTVVSFKPGQRNEPLSCNLNHCEVFSCVLGMEDETALSIIDPVTISMDLKCQPRSPNDDVRGNQDQVLVIQTTEQLNVRLSYHDVRMFMQMISSLKQQTVSARSQEFKMHCRPANFSSQVYKLSALGFETEDCAQALDRCDGKIDDAALWLTQYAVNRPPLNVPEQTSVLSFQFIQMNVKCLSICVIDDCRDADVPLLELSLSSLNAEQNYSNGGCKIEGVLASDYYNRVLSGWEPFVEPWSFKMLWDRVRNSDGSELTGITVKSDELLNVNITSTLVELYKAVKENWTEDYYCTNNSRLTSSPAGHRRRSPFVPFALRNDTGSRVFFATCVTSADRVTKHNTEDSNVQWIPVAPGATVPFTFEERGKLRHQNTHKYKIHQLGICVEGWRPVPPISVDKVGIYFRQAVPESQRSHLDLPGARVVLEVILEGSAQKLVVVRSALLVKNQLQDPVELRLENTLLQGSAWAGVKMIQIAPQSVMPIPLTHTLAQLWVRPVTGSYHAFSSHPISWTAVTKPGDTMEETHSCQANRGNSYRFCAAVTRENYPLERTGLWVQPAHTITLLCCVTVVNLLPYDLHYAVQSKTLSASRASGVIKPGGQDPVREVDIDGSIELSFHLDNFPGAGTLVLPPQPSSSFTQRLRLHDLSSRRLFLQASVHVNKGSAIKVVVWSPYWIVNKTGLPLVFRQEGVPEETAGQFAEHEVARMVAPLLFSFSDHEASPTIVARVGSGVHTEGVPQWCDHFHLHPGVQFCRLLVSFRESRPDVIYLMGVEVKTGRGRYRRTNIVTLSPHYQLFNRSSYKLQFAQKYFATTLSDPGAQATYLTAVPNCCLPFHWPRQEKEQLLCVRLLAVPNCLWSGGFRINVTDSLHVNIRDRNGRMYFLRLEIVLQGATYFVVFSDANTMPPPIRVDNYSEVPLLFYQSCVQVESLQWSIRPHLSMPYAWDEPTQGPSISLVAPGGATASYDMNVLGRGRDLTYENFIYIAFTGTFKNVSDGPFDPLDVEGQQLVLDVPPGGTRVVLARKEQGARSQLWRMTGEGQLQHEGSSPPRDPHRSHSFGSSSTSSSDKILVLDIAGPAPQPSQYVGLTLRRVDNRRKSTQTWRFTEDGRLCCAHNNMCVQAKDGFFGLRQGCEAVLGPPQPVTHRLTEEGVPLEQAVSRQRLRPGSGFLAVNVLTDGPTRVLEITDIKSKQKYALLEERDWAHISATQRPSLIHNDLGQSSPNERVDINICLFLERGLGISVVSRQPPEELVFIRLVGIALELQLGSDSQKVSVSVEDIQVDNQLYNAQCPVLLYVNPTTSKRGGSLEAPQPAIVLAAERLTSPNINAEIFKYLTVVITRLCLSIEESLLLKLVIWAGYKPSIPVHEDVGESEFETQRILSEATSIHAKRYYFGHMQLMPSEFRLSVFTSNKLPPELQAVKRKLGLRLIKFEDACVDLGGFVKQHPFETSQFLFSSIVKHYQQMLKWRAHNILGSSDFLGNPAALASDVSEGFSGLIFEGSVKTLVKNVAHGLTNSTAKFTESLGDGLGHVIMDEQHDEARRRMRGGNTVMEHFTSGLKGLGFGVLGGITSVVKQTWDGAANDGVPGAVTGMAKGLVGTVTKPVIGVLDFASEGASAFRDLCRDSNRLSPTRYRTPRCVVGPGGLLPPYSAKQSEGQEFLYTINERNYSEILMAYEVLLSGTEDLRILVSSEKVRVFSCAGSQSGSQPNATVVLQALLSDLFECQPVAKQDGSNTLHFIELTIRADISGGASGGTSQESIKRPLVRCNSERVSVWVSQQVNYAKEMFEERRYTLLRSSSNFMDE
ncbi:vacuolar protein sorting-associated protein 13D isoform X2 [Thrips palmi]|uniref:Vacuolar protein sorting-associated protein 13D isoform X2 n=1 Tax=Thrips palmi TaxID=161013 RepID=A0A6P8Z4M6_THRPL|nr:vacuolar protein sorting-associated protein 13D isoform X2 [Thrips palmi]